MEQELSTFGAPGFNPSWSSCCSIFSSRCSVL